MNATASPNLEIFLAEAPWLRGLARTLASPAEAEDLVQAAYERLVTHPPKHQDSPRGWLGTVLRNTHRMRLRGAIRREAREANAGETAPLPTAETLAAQAEVWSLLARAVAELDEPFRRTVLLHYYEGCSLADIARDEGCPAATVRTRLRTSLQRLRAELDEAHGGKRALWAAVVSPAAAASPAVASGTVVLGAAVGLALVTGVAAATFRSPDPTGEVVVVASGTAAAATPADESSTAPTPAPPAPVVAHAASPVDKAAKAAKAAKADKPDEADASSSAEAVRAERLAKVKDARLQRLRTEGLGNVVDDAAKDETFLSDIEAMMMMESGAELAESCREEAAPKPNTTRMLDIDFLGEPDVGTVIETVSAQLEAGEAPEAWTRCLVESMYLISLAPPMKPGAQRVTLKFAVDAEGKLMTSTVEQAERSNESVD